MGMTKRTTAVKAAVPAATFVEPETVGTEETGTAEPEETEAGEAEETEAGEAEKPETDAAPVDPWAALEAPKTRTAEPLSATVDVEKDTPLPIRMRLAESYGIAKAAADVKDATDAERAKATRAAWKVQGFPSQTMLDDFVKLAKRYCSKREQRWTFRSKQNEKALAAGRFELVYIAKPFEARESA